MLSGVSGASAHYVMLNVALNKRFNDTHAWVFKPPNRPEANLSQVHAYV